MVRGGPAFAVSLVLTSIEQRMRGAGELGAWQVISPSAAFGRLEIVPDLHGIQDKVYDTPTVLLARHVSGEEEVPVGVVGVVRCAAWSRGSALHCAASRCMARS